MNTPKRIASRTMRVLSCLLVLASLLVTGIGFHEFFRVLHESAHSDSLLIMGCGPVLGILLLGFSLWGMNRACCLIWIRDGVLHRRGLFFGYRRSCALREIVQVAAVWQGRGGRYLFVEDTRSGTYQAAKKDSYIFLEDTPDNRRFITDFCGQMIRERNVFGK